MIYLPVIIEIERVLQKARESFIIIFTKKKRKGDTH